MIRLFHGDCREAVRHISQVDAVVCDPPYHLTSVVKRFGKGSAAPAKSNGATGVYKRASTGFMGQSWDGGDVAFQPETWATIAEAMKPGAHLVAFGGSRTFHRLAVAIEDAGLELRDTLMWAYVSGFPKSHDVSKAIDKAAGHWRGRAGEVIDRTVGQVAKGTEYVRTEKGEPVTDEAARWQGWGTALKPAFEPIILARKPLDGTVAANVLAHGVGGLNIDGCRVGTDGGSVTVVGDRHNTTVHAFGDGLGAQGGSIERPDGLGRWPANILHDGSPEVLAMFPDGAARRIFYSAKANKADRAGSKHPTVKPQSLMRWLCRLVTPPGGVVLDPFAGSGSTLAAATAEGFDAIGCDITEQWIREMEARFSVQAQRLRPTLTAKAGQWTYDQFIEAGWSDEQLRTEGYLA